MCGIIGTNFLSDNFSSALDNLNNRGPDFKKSIKVNDNEFGHTRLSIIDLDAEANQPMVFDDLVLVFNGEIYNYKELIKQENLECKTQSDSEVIIRLYQKYKKDCVKKLNGMFAFCIYDIKEDKFFCARDRYGKKPFFYYCIDGKFIFSSSIKSILKILDTKPKINKVAVNKYFQYFVSYGEDTFYQGIKKLEASKYLEYNNKNSYLNTKRYYKINTYKNVSCETTALKDIEELLFQSLNRRLVSDVEVGALLSGGIDSSLICAMYSQISSKKINTFSIGYDEYKNYCELPYAEISARYIDSNHHPIQIGQKDFIDYFEDTLEALEEPHADSAAIPLNIMTKKIHNMGIKTVLSGEGSDELFLGYYNYAKFLKYYEFEKSLSNKQNSFLDDIIGALQNNTKESEYLRRVVKKENLYNSFGEVYTDIQRKKLFNKLASYKKEKSKNDPVDWMSYIDLKIWLGDALLTKVDRVSMRNSLEVRTPFLDMDLLDYVFRVNSNIKVGDTNKYLLKKIAKKYIPQQIINRTKKGFNSPFNEWLNDYYKDDILNTILKANRHSKFFNEEYIRQIYHLAQKKKFKQHLYSLFVFSKWYIKEYM